MLRTVEIQRNGEPLRLEVEALWSPAEGDGWHSPLQAGCWLIDGTITDEHGRPIDLSDDEIDSVEVELNEIDEAAEWTDDYEPALEE